MKIALLLTALILLAAYLYSKYAGDGFSNASKDIQYGPFTVRAKVRTFSTYNMNFRRVSQTTVEYAVLYKGKSVPFPGALQNNTGLPFMWSVYAVPGAPDPTLVAGSQSLYLIYEKDGAAVVEPILQQGHDFASLQILDGPDGRPGPFTQLFSKSDSVGFEKLDSLEGGRYLMVSEHAVLDLQTRKIWPMNKDNNPVDNYSYPSPHGALAFSSDQKTIVFQAEFQGWNTETEDLPDSEHALVAWQFEKDSGYVVKYDDTDTRMTNVQRNDYAWFKTYFDWKKSPEGDRLHLRHFEKLPPWSGRFNPEDNYYTLYPVKAGMLPVFLDFVLAQAGWTKDNILNEKYHEYTGRCIYLGQDALKLDIIFKEDEQKLSLSKYLYDDKSPESVDLVKKIADAFNAELSAGKHQAHFGRILSQTKELRGGYK